MANDRRLIVLGYAREIVITVVSYIFLYRFWSPMSIYKVVLDNAIAWIGLMGAFFAFASGLWGIIFWNVMSSDFGNYLRWRGVSTSIQTFFAAPACAFVVTIVLLILTAWSRSWPLAHISSALLIYSIINVFSLFKNGRDLMKLYSEYHRWLQNRN